MTENNVFSCKSVFLLCTYLLIYVCRLQMYVNFRKVNWCYLKKRHETKRFKINKLKGYINKEMLNVNSLEVRTAIAEAFISEISTNLSNCKVWYLVLKMHLSSSFSFLVIFLSLVKFGCGWVFTDVNYNQLLKAHGEVLKYDDDVDNEVAEVDMTKLKFSLIYPGNLNRITQV